MSTGTRHRIYDPLLRLEISVDDMMSMAVLDGANHLLKNRLASSSLIFRSVLVSERDYASFARATM